jgi:hypothetical protein
MRPNWDKIMKIAVKPHHLDRAPQSLRRTNESNGFVTALLSIRVKSGVYERDDARRHENEGDEGRSVSRNLVSPEKLNGNSGAFVQFRPEPLESGGHKPV